MKKFNPTSSVASLTGKYDGKHRNPITPVGTEHGDWMLNVGVSFKTEAEMYAALDAIKSLFTGDDSVETKHRLADDVIDAADEIMGLLDRYPEQLVPLNRKSVSCNILRTALAHYAAADEK